jgi:hypothetical protein
MQHAIEKSSFPPIRPTCLCSGAYLAHILNTLVQITGRVVSNAPGPIDLAPGAAHVISNPSLALSEYISHTSSLLWHVFRKMLWRLFQKCTVLETGGRRAPQRSAAPSSTEDVFTLDLRSAAFGSPSANSSAYLARSLKVLPVFFNGIANIGLCCFVPCCRLIDLLTDRLCAVLFFVLMLVIQSYLNNIKSPILYTQVQFARQLLLSLQIYSF